MNDEQTAEPSIGIGNASDANGEGGNSPQSLNLYPEEPAAPTGATPEASPTTDTSAANGDIGEGVQSVVEPPKSDLATPATPSPEEAKELEYSLTLKQVPTILSEANRNVPSLRTLTRYCKDGGNFLKCQKIKTSYGQEWLVNVESLEEYIDHQPIITTSAETMSEPIEDTAAIGDAGNASDATPEAQSSENSQQLEASSTSATTATEKPVVEDRTLAAALIENARLTAQVEDRDTLVDELKDDRAFLREEVREARQYRGDIKDISNRMLKTMTEMSKTAALKNLSIDQIEAFARGSQLPLESEDEQSTGEENSPTK